MGSISDFDVMVSGVRVLQKLGIPYEVRVMSAHRSPHSVAAYAADGAERGLQVIIAGAGGAAHLAGAIAAHTRLPVIGVPLVASALGGLDALLATVQMPGGVPVATVGVGKSGAVNAAHLAARILALGEPVIVDSVEADRSQQTANVDAMQTDLEDRLAGEGL
jgi:phosphoribosylaminoimidazole carboxylase PurE protein